MNSKVVGSVAVGAVVVGLLVNEGEDDGAIVGGDMRRGLESLDIVGCVNNDRIDVLTSRASHGNDACSSMTSPSGNPEAARRCGLKVKISLSATLFVSEGKNVFNARTAFSPPRAFGCPPMVFPACARVL